MRFSDKSTCLHDAAYTGDIKMIALLLSLGADGMKQVYKICILYKIINISHKNFTHVGIKTRLDAYIAPFSAEFMA